MTNIKGKEKTGKAINYLFLLIMFLTFINSVKGQTDKSFWFVAPRITTRNWGPNTPIVLRFASLGNACIITISEPANPSFTPIVNSLAANSSLYVDLSLYVNIIQNQPPDSILNYGIDIESTELITAYYDECQGMNPEIFSLKGSNALGTTFYVSGQNFWYNWNDIGWPAPDAFSAFDIVATEDNTTVTIIPTNDIIGHNANVSFTKKLNKGQTYSARAVSQLATGHLEGSYVTSNNPIAITISDDDARDDSYGGCSDLIGDQTVPVNMTGTKYIVIEGSLTGADNVFITATQDNTSIFINGSTTAVTTINAGVTFEYDVSSTTYIETSNPAYVYQVTGYGCEAGSAILPPIECTGSTEISFTRSLPDYFALMLIVETGGEGSFILNGNSTYIPASSFSTVPGTNGGWQAGKISFTTTQVPVGTASIITNTSSKFGMGMITSSGGGNGCSYGYFSNFNFTQNAKNNIQVCTGDTLQLSTDTTINGGTYSWTGPNGFISTQQNPKIPAATNLIAGLYNATVSVDSCPSLYAEVTVAVNPKPIVKVSPVNITICEGTGINLTAIGANTYTWSPSAGLSTTTGDSVTTNPITTTTYTVTGTLNGCTNTANVTVTVNPLPSIIVAPNPATICSGNSVTLTASKGNTYSWSPAAGLNTTNGATVTANPIATTTYTVAGTLNGCTDTANVIVTVNPLPTITVKPNPTTICSGNSVTLTASGASTYSWSPAGGLNTTTGTNVSASPAITTTYTVAGIAANGCNGSDSVIVNVVPISAPILSSNSPVCEGTILSLFAKENDTLFNNYKYNWTGPNGFISGQQNPVINNVSVAAGGKYSANAITGNCSASSTTDVIVYANPSNFLPSDTSICEDSSFTIIAKKIFNSYFWQDGSTGNFIIVHGAGNYWLRVIDNNGCTATDTIQIIKSCPPVIYVPNAFNPEGVNSIFFAKAPNGVITKFSMDIFNRWGALLFHSDDINKGWDGKFNGKGCPVDVYVYCIHYEGVVENNIEKKTKIGSVTLLR